MTLHSERLARLRAGLAGAGLDGFIVPLTDEHLSEYVGTYARRLEWLTGFSGSAGTAVILADRAAIFTDGRYTLQVRQQTDPALFEYRSVPADSIADWLGAHAPDGARIGYDSWLSTRPFVARTADVLARRQAALVAVSANPVDAIWADRPAPSAAPAEVHPLIHAGEASADKRQRLAADIAAAGADLLVLSALDEIAWTFNLRGADVPRTPVVRSFALLGADGRATLFIDPAKVGADVAGHLGAEVELRPYAAFAAALAELGNRAVLVDPAAVAVAVMQALEGAGARLVEGRSPVVLAKAIKNATELAGARAAHQRDGRAVCRFLHWLDTAVAGGTLDELVAEARLEAFRREAPELRDLSFDSISGFGPNGAIVHYRATPETCRKLAGNGLYLIDSGGQYADGTTDITRTIAVGAPEAAMRDRFTRVLKGHIALATARFPKGARGGQLDVLARQFLWAAGLDYAHGTGHGVGSYLSVHEGPQRISAAATVDEPLAPGMIVSNEPGYYAEGAFGIRIENLVVVVADQRPDDERPMFAFETLTLAPIDLRLVEPALLLPAEAEWLDAYHARVRAAIGPLLDPAARAWLEERTLPLAAFAAQPGRVATA